MPFGGGLTAGIIAGVSALSSYLASRKARKAAETASSQQANAGQGAINSIQGILGQQQASQQPYTDAGSISIGMLMEALKSGTFGPGSLPGAPQFTGTFNAPTLQEARDTPGYQFAAQQGGKGILQGAAAAGGAISGGTMKALADFNVGLADTTYGNVFERALSTFGAGLQGYQANLQGYQMNLARQAQEFNQVFQPAVLGQTAVQNLNNNRTQAGVSIADLMTQIGNAQAAGTIGSVNATNAGIAGISNAATSALSRIGDREATPQNATISQLMKLPSRKNPLTPAMTLGPG